MSGNFVASSDFLTALAFTIKEEGGYGNDPRDPGGATNFGVTIGAWSEYVGYQVSTRDIAALTIDVVTPFYHQCYFNALRCWGMPRGTSLMVFDHGVNAGVRCAALILQAVVSQAQSIVEVAQDGIIGAITAQATRAVPALKLIGLLHDAMAADYRTKGDFPTYGEEWLGRLDRCQTEALRIANA